MVLVSARMLQVAALALLVGCTTARGSFCDIASPLRLSDQVIDQMSDAEVADALAYNKRGQELCGWKA